MNVKEIMNTDVKLISPSATIQDAAERMATRDIGFLPVGDDKLRGSITDRDIVLRAVGKDKDVRQTSVSDILTGEVFYCYEDSDIESAAASMGEQQVRRLPVVNAEKDLVGVVSLGDIVPHLSGDTVKSVLAGITRKKAA